MSKMVNGMVGFMEMNIGRKRQYHPMAHASVNLRSYPSTDRLGVTTSLQKQLMGRHNEHGKEGKKEKLISAIVPKTNLIIYLTVMPPKRRTICCTTVFQILHNFLFCLS